VYGKFYFYSLISKKTFIREEISKLNAVASGTPVEEKVSIIYSKARDPAHGHCKALT